MRLRITFSKSGLLAYTSHLDLARAWERSLRRAGLPLAYSRGFNPRPKLQLAAALPLGCTGEAEMLDVWLERPLPVEDLVRALTPVLPDGLAVGQVREVRAREPPLQTRVVSAEYRVTVECAQERAQVERRIDRALAAPELPQERRGKRYDLRPLIESLWLERWGVPLEGEVSGVEAVLGMQLAAREGATARPEAVLEALGMRGPFARYHRVRLILSSARPASQSS